MSPAFCRQVGHWRVSKEVIGSGTTSTVHLASHTNIPTFRAAVKIVSRTDLLLKADGDPTALHLADAVIHREVLLMKLASHERIVKLYDFVGHGDLVYMIMEHAPNKTLFDLFRCHPSFLPAPLITHLFSQLMHALDHIHSLHIVHRDIKLENVFLFGPDVKDVLQADLNHSRNHKYKHRLPYNSRHPHTPTPTTPPHPYTVITLKLADFGLSHTHTPTALSTVFHGSPHYQAPELWARVPHRAFPTDVWSAGVVLFALAGRRLPFGVGELEEWGAVFNEGNSDELYLTEHEHEHASRKGVRKGHTNRPPVPRPGTPSHMPYDALEVIPPAVDHLLHRLFALDPAMRPTALEVLADAMFSGIEFVSSREDVSVLQSSKHRASRQPIPSQLHTHPSPHHTHADAYDSHDLYDIATLCTPPSKHVPRSTFHGSSLERRVRKRLGCEKECIERVWADRLGAWAAWEGEEGMGVREKEKEKGVPKKEKKVDWGERKAWSMSLGRIRGADVRVHLANLGHLGHVGHRGHTEQAVHEGQRGMNSMVLKPKVGASLSFRSLRIKTEHKPSEPKHPQANTRTSSPLASTSASRHDAFSTLQIPPSPLKPKLSFRTLRIKTSDYKHTPPSSRTPSPNPTRSTLQSPLAPTFASQRDATAIIRYGNDAASTLQYRHDALLRRAYELGFRTEDLRAFADEAGRIVRDAGTKGDGGDDANGGEMGAITPAEGSESTTTTLVPENGGGEQKSGVSVASAVVPVVKVVGVGVGRAGKGLDVDVGVSFDVNFETDLHWI